MTAPIYQPALDIGLPVHRATPGATVYVWQPGGRQQPKFLVVEHTGKETWCSPEAWAIQRAEAVKPPRAIRPKAIQLDLFVH